MTAAENTTEFRALATEMLLEFGVSVTFTMRTGGAYDPAQGLVVGGGTTTYPDTLMSPPVPASRQLFSKEIVEASDAMVILSAPDITFTPKNSITFVGFDGEEWSVLGVETYYPGLLPAIHILAIRRP